MIFTLTSISKLPWFETGQVEYYQSLDKLSHYILQIFKALVDVLARRKSLELYEKSWYEVTIV